MGISRSTVSRAAARQCEYFCREWTRMETNRFRNRIKRLPASTGIRSWLWTTTSSISNLCTEILQLQGYTVLSATEPAEALDVAARH